MALYLTEEDVSALLDMPGAMTAVEAAFNARARGGAWNIHRQRIPTSNGTYQIMSASWPERGIAGTKAYTTGRGAGAKFHVTLYDASGQGLLVMIEASRLGQIRTGAASGVATKFMARRDADIAAVIGSGYQAETQLEAVANARKLRSARVYSRTPEKRDQFARKMSEKLGFPVSASASVAECVRGAAIVITITNSSEPVLTGDLLEPGMHVNAAGSNSWLRRELDVPAIARCGVIAVDDLDGAKVECGELIRAAETPSFSWDKAVTIDKIVAGDAVGRHADSEITLFESQGIALEDIAAGELILRLARARGLGRQIP